MKSNTLLFWINRVVVALYAVGPQQREGRAIFLMWIIATKLVRFAACYATHAIWGWETSRTVRR
jgi:hypothetical protein